MNYLSFKKIYIRTQVPPYCLSGDTRKVNSSSSSSSVPVTGGGAVTGGVDAGACDFAFSGAFLSCPRENKLNRPPFFFSSTGPLAVGDDSGGAGARMLGMEYG